MSQQPTLIFRAYEELDDSEHLPDLGLFLKHSDFAFSKLVKVELLEFNEIALLSESKYSAFFRVWWQHITFGASVDFGPVMRRKILSELDESLQNDYHASLFGITYPFLSKLPAPAIVREVMCHLAPIEWTRCGECFVPFKVHSKKSLRQQEEVLRVNGDLWG